MVVHVIDAPSVVCEHFFALRAAMTARGQGRVPRRSLGTHHRCPHHMSCLGPRPTSAPSALGLGPCPISVGCKCQTFLDIVSILSNTLATRTCRRNLAVASRQNVGQIACRNSCPVDSKTHRDACWSRDKLYFPFVRAIMHLRSVVFPFFKSLVDCYSLR